MFYLLQKEIYGFENHGTKNAKELLFKKFLKKNIDNSKKANFIFVFLKLLHFLDALRIIP